MTNKPKFTLFKNIAYAMAGMREVLRTETSFKTQLAAIALVSVGLFFAPLPTMSKLVLFVSMWLIPLVEAINSAIERVVDLVTQEHHPLAGQAKDIGAFAVFVAFVIVVMIWGVVLYGVWMGA
jgi:diacylglycerol kinase (ATP)